MNMQNKIKIIAEAGVNHNGSLKNAYQLVDIALESGVDVVKFQTFKTENLVSKKLKKADYQSRNLNNEDSQFKMLKSLELSFEDHMALKQYCDKKEIEYLSTPFDIDSLNFLVEKEMIRSLKIPSGEITNYPFLFEIAKKRLPIILSTGMATLSEVEQALCVLAYGLSNENNNPNEKEFWNFYYTKEAKNILKKYLNILHCTTEYPAPISEVNLNAMSTLHIAFGLNVGYSDHTEGIIIPTAAAALGATIIEKHFTINRNLPGPDHKASLEPEELKAMVNAIRSVELSLGDGRKIPSKSEIKNKNIVRKVLVARKNISKGDTFSFDNLTMKRAGSGLSTMEYWNYLNKISEKNYNEDDIIE